MAEAVFVYKADPARGALWAAAFAQLAPHIRFRIWPDVGDPAAVRYLAAWLPPDDIAGTFPNLQLLFSVGAGVDQFDFAALPPTLPLVRMVEPGIVAGMVEYVCCAVLALHRDWPLYLQQQRQALWRPSPVRPAASCRVGVLGLGSLGQAVLSPLRALGFDCAGWSRSAHRIDGVRCFAGAEERDDFLARTDILVCLLPLTAQTRGVLDAGLLSRLPRGAALVNAGRGPHLVADALIAALDSGQLRAAVLDVCDPEPPPADHPFWQHPQVWMTPHIASVTQPHSAVEAVLANLQRHARGEALVGLVDRERGY